MIALISAIAILQSVALVALALIVIGLGLSVLTWWFWSTARPEPVSLAPLEIMSDRRFANASEAEQQVMLESAHGIIKGAKSPRKTRRTARLTETHSTPERTQRNPVDPMLK